MKWDWIDQLAQPFGFYAGVPEWLRAAGGWILAAAVCAFLLAEIFKSNTKK
jgi:hypothetical protein